MADFATTSTMAKVIVMSMGASAGAAGGVVADTVLVPDQAIWVRMLLAVLGSATALMLRPPVGTKAMIARFWAGSFGGFLASPFVPALPFMGWVSGQGSDVVALSAAAAAFVLFFMLQIAAEVLGSPKAATVLANLIWRRKS